MKQINKLPLWESLKSHKKQIDTESMIDSFRINPMRFSDYSLFAGDILLDYSKNRISSRTIALLIQLAEAVNLSSKIESLFTGAEVNTTEKRPALHTALRNKSNTPVYVNHEDVMPLVNDNLAKMRVFTDKVRTKKWLGATGKPISDIINVGIGGSHLGPLTTTHALAEYASTDMRCHFISNVDASHLFEVLNKVDPESTLFIISSKSFTTLETITNAHTLKTWLSEKIGRDNIAPHFVAITAEHDKAIEFGIPTAQIFPLWDWVGGRYSIWSAIGLPLALMIGMDHFQDFLEGAHEMDLHFRHADFSANMPVLLGLLGIWYINFFCC